MCVCASLSVSVKSYQKEYAITPHSDFVSLSIELMNCDNLKIKKGEYVFTL
jgi:hypothetical protein